MAWGLPSYQSNYGVGRTRTPYGSSSPGGTVPASTIESNLRSPQARYEMQASSQGTGTPVSEQRAMTLVGQGYTSGRSIADYQRFLAARGLYRGRIDGVWGPQTEAAQKAYRQWAAANAYKMQEGLEATAAKEAAAARARLLELSKEAARMFGAKTGAEWAKFADPNRYGNQAAIVAVKQAESVYASTLAERRRLSEQKRAKERSIGGGLQKLATGALRGLSYAGEQLSSAYYGSKRSQLTGGGLGEQVQAFAGGLPGLGFLAGDGRARRAIEETNTPEERAALTRRGELASFGEFISGRAEGKLNPETLRAAQNYGGLRVDRVLPDKAAPLLDAAMQIGTDPLSYLGRATKAAGLVTPVDTAGANALRRAGLTLDTTAGQLAAFGGRLDYVQGNAVGRALVDRVMAAAASATDAKQLQRWVKSLSFAQADEIVRAPLSQRRLLIEHTLAETGIKLGARKQALIKATGDRVGTGEVVSRGTLRAKGGEALRRIARGDEPKGGMLRTKKSGAGLGYATESGLLRAGSGERFLDIANRVVRPAVEGMDIPTRIGRVWNLAEKTGNGAFMDAAERQLKGLLDEAKRRGVSADAIVNGTELPPHINSMLERLEVAAAVLTGEAGDLAATQAGLDLSTNLVPKQMPDGYALVKRAGKSVGLTLPRARKLKFSEAEARLLKAEIQTAIRDVDDALADTLVSDLNKISANRGSLGPVRAAVDALKRNPELLDEAGRIALNAYRMAEQAVEDVVVPGLGRRALQKAASLPLAFSEARYADRLSWEGQTANAIMNASDRVEQLDRWFMGFGLDDFTRGRLRQAAAEVRSEVQLYDLVKSVAIRQGKRMGIEPSAIRALFKEMRKQVHSDKATLILPDGSIARDVYTQAQLGDAIPMIDPTELRKMLTVLKAEQGNIGSKIRTKADEFGNRPLGELKSGDAPLTVRRILRKGHTEWKFLVVTNFYAGGVGAVGGFIGSDDQSIGGRLWNGLRWGVGAQVASPLRYIMRVAGVEEGLRKYLAAGFTPEVWVPVVGKRLRQRGVDIPFQSYDLIRGSSAPVEWLQRTNKHLITVDRGWEKLGRNDKRYIDSWFRNVNRQMHVESDPVAELLLREKAEHISRAQADEMLTKFSKTEDGKLFIKRIQSGTGNKGRAFDSIIERYRMFIDHHFDETLAEARLTGDVSHELLTQAARAGRGPELIHAPKTWIVPKNIREVFALRDRLASKFVLEGPTSKLNRVPLAEHIYKKEYTSLVKNGVPKERAAAQADEIAVRRTNEVLFNINDESRFAAKADVFTPFQQPREEMVRVWGKLVSQNPARSVIVAANAARAFNAGVQNGQFYKDPFTGDYSLRTPNSAGVSALLGNVIGFESTLKDYVFFGQGAYNMGFLPSPGGPYFGTAARVFLDTDMGKEILKEMPDSLRQLMFPYGADGQIMPRGSNRLWMALTYSTPPWEFVGKFDQQNVLNKAEQGVMFELLTDYFKKNGKYPEDIDKFYRDEVVPATKAMLKSWALMTMLNPAAVRPLYAGEREFYEIRKIYTDSISKDVDIASMIEDHPWTQLFIDRGGKAEYIGPQDYDTWKNGTDPEIARMLHYSRTRSGREYVSILNEARDRTRAMKEMFELTNIPNPLMREEALAEWRERNPELADKLRTNYGAQKDLARILAYPRGQIQDKALDDWRRLYDISPLKYQSMKREIEQGRFRTNPWQDARDMEDVYADVRKQMRKGFNEDAYVATLMPTEQIRYWNQKMLNLNADALGSNRSAKSVMDEWKVLKSKQAQVWQAHPFLSGLPKPKSAMEKAIAAWQGNYRQGVNDLWAQINSLQAAKNQAAQSKNWGTYYKLKAQIDSLHDARIALMNKMYHEVPNLPGMMDELRGNFAFGGPKARGGEGDFIFSNEEEAFVKMPDGIRKAYIQDLVDRLDQENFTKGKVFWEWLTDFQRDLISANLSKEDIDYFKGLSPDSGGKGGSGGRGFGGRGFGGGGFSGELSYAFSLFKEYNRRGSAKAPAAYAEYLKLPNDSVVRGQFLKDHPEVRDWVKLGPMANMPPVLRYIVANIMIKYGKWEGEQRDFAAITDLAFAQEQMTRFNLRRDMTKPASYDVWVNMPTGPEKAAFLKAHPEVQRWIQLGPMVNMPEEYQDVVRDIMLKYGEWTERDDPLGQTIRGYYKLPQHARDQYLKDHPELTEYWAATRSPLEKAQYALADQYFALQDQGAKRFFLLSHPELQSWFIEQRTKRYERFLNRVAVYMGQNPGMFEHYLKRQEDILTELLTRFAESPLVREIRPQTAAKATSTESGRRRTVAA